CPDPNSYSDTSSYKIFRNGTIGGEIMSRFTIVYDFPNEKVYLKKNSSFKKAFHYNLSGLTIKSKGAKLNVFEITGVRGGSSADKAGVQAGDILVSINGVDLKEVD